MGRHILKGWFPQYHTQSIPPHTHAHTVLVQQPLHKSETAHRGTRGYTYSKLQTWNSPFPSTDELLKRSPCQNFGSAFLCGEGNCATQTQLKVYSTAWWPLRRRRLYFQGVSQRKDANDQYPEAIPQHEAHISFSQSCLKVMVSGWVSGTAWARDAQCKCYMFFSSQLAKTVRRIRKIKGNFQKTRDPCKEKEDHF